MVAMVKDVRIRWKQEHARREFEELVSIAACFLKLCGAGNVRR